MLIILFNKSEIYLKSNCSTNLELIRNDTNSSIFKDFAHSPSKVKATLEAVKNQFSNHNLIACFELHTFSSLNSEFLLQYKNTLEVADSAIVYFSNKTIVSKKLEPLNIEDVRLSFNNLKLEVFDNPLDLNKYLNLSLIHI